MIADLVDMFASPMMQRALIAALLVGVSAPVVGTYLVQRRLSLLGDGIGHIALTGVAVGWLAGSLSGMIRPDALAVPGAVVASVIGSVAIEIVRERGRTSADLALALLFYGGIAGGVLIIGMAGGSSANLMSYLFGSISSVSTSDVLLIVGLSVVILAVGIGLRSALFAVSHDEEFARASGLPVRALNVAVAVIAALTVTVSMRVVGLLLVSALMIVPVAVAQLLTRSFRSTMAIGCLIGTLVCVVGLCITYWQPWSPGAAIVVLAVLLYLVVAMARPILTRRRSRDPHPDIPDDVQLDTAVAAVGKGDEACSA